MWMMGFGQLNNVELEFLKFWTLIDIKRHYRFVLSVSILQIPSLYKPDSNKILSLSLLHILSFSLNLNFDPPLLQIFPLFLLKFHLSPFVCLFAVYPSSSSGWRYGTNSFCQPN